jgi:hypothetical protein
MPCHTQPKNRSESGKNKYPRDCNPVLNGDGRVYCSSNTHKLMAVKKKTKSCSFSKKIVRVEERVCA